MTSAADRSKTKLHHVANSRPDSPDGWADRQPPLAGGQPPGPHDSPRASGVWRVGLVATMGLVLVGIPGCNDLGPAPTIRTVDAGMVLGRIARYFGGSRIAQRVQAPQGPAVQPRGAVAKMFQNAMQATANRLQVPQAAGRQVRRPRFSTGRRFTLGGIGVALDGRLERASGGYRPIWTKALLRATAPQLSVFGPRRRPATRVLPQKNVAKRALRPFFPDRFDSAVRVASSSGVELEVYAEGARNVEASTQGGVVVYPEAYPGVDVIYAAQPRRVEEFLLVRVPRRSDQFRYVLRGLSNVGQIREAGDGVAIYDAKGAMRLRVAKPVALDAAGRERHGRVSLGQGCAGQNPQACTLVVALNTRGLQFPVLIDPTFVEVGDLLAADTRLGHNAVLLQDGRLAIFFGRRKSNLTFAQDVLVYSPTTGQWDSGVFDGPPIADLRFGATATLLQNGKVLFVGGRGHDGTPMGGPFATPGDYQHTTLLFDPRELPGSQWVAGPPMATRRIRHTATMLGNGTVLIAGGLGCGSGTSPCTAAEATSLSSAEIYDPTSGIGSFSTTTTSMATSRFDHSAVYVPSTGHVQVFGGFNGDVLINASPAVIGTSNQAVTYTPLAEGSAGNGLTVEHVCDDGVSVVTVVEPGAGSNDLDVLLPGDVPGVGCAVLGTVTVAQVIAAVNAGSTILEASTTGTSENPVKGTATTGSNGQGPPVALASTERYETTTPEWEGSGAGTVDLPDPVGTGTSPRGTFTATLLPGTPSRIAIFGGTTDEISAVPTVIVYTAASDLNDSATTYTGTSYEERWGHTANLLPNGQVLVAGGNASSTTTRTSAQVISFDHGAKTYTVESSDPSVKRTDHSATVLASGAVVLAGGQVPEETGGAQDVVKTEVYDPSDFTGGLASLTTMTEASKGATAILLPNGKVLVAFGATSTGGTLTTNAYVFDPAGMAGAGSWTAANDSGGTARRDAPAVLWNGKAIVIGGAGASDALASVRSFDPGGNTWAALASLGTERREHTATLMPDGKILVTGGGNNTTAALATTEIYSPDTDSWAAGPTMATARRGHTATLNRDGKVIVFGGFDAGGTAQNSVEILDFGSFTTSSPTGTAPAARGGHSAVLLRDGRILVAFGNSGSTSLATAALFDPTAEAWTAAGAGAETHGLGHKMVALRNGKVLVVGGADVSVDVLELYEPELNMWIPVSIPPTNTPPWLDMAAVPLADGRILLAGGQGDDGAAVMIDGAFALDLGHAPVAGRAPTITTANTSGKPDGVGTPDSTLSIVGTQFAQFEASGGNSTQNSSVGYPLATFVRIPDGLTFTIPPTPTTWTNTTMSVPIAATMPLGYYVLTVTNAGVPSAGKIVLVTKKALGDNTCSAGSECNSGNCVDGVCCATTCDTCQECAAGTGICTNVTSNTQDDDSCNSAGFVCNGNSGASACVKIDGQSCSVNADCFNSNCVDGICCPGSCTNECESCAAIKTGGTDGVCGTVQIDKQTTNNCTTANFACNGTGVGAGTCDKVNGQVCASASDCVSNKCVDLRCCNSDCTGACDVCNGGTLGLTGGAVDGTCSNAPDGEFGGNPSCAPYVCGGGSACPAAGSCATNADCSTGNYCATAATKAALVVAATAGNGAVKYEAFATGAGGDSIQVSQTSDSTTAADCISGNVVITVASGGTVGDVAAAVTAQSNCNSVVTATVIGDPGATANGALALTSLAGGTTSGSCLAVRSNGEACAYSMGGIGGQAITGQCSSGTCTDEGICCAGACDGVCKTCIGGTCANHTDDTDPEGGGGNCAPYQCQTGDCGLSCADNSDCDSLSYCTGGSGVKAQLVVQGFNFLGAVRYLATDAGTAGNSIVVIHDVPNSTTASTSAVCGSNTVTVTLKTDDGIASAATIADVVAAVIAGSGCAAMVTPTAVGDQADIVADNGAGTSLVGGNTNGVCALRRIDGAGCESAVTGQCESTVCNDEGICCNVACDGGCQTCASGVCSGAVADGTDPEVACGNFFCDGATTTCPSGCVGDVDCKSGAFCDDRAGGGPFSCVSDQTPPGANACIRDTMCTGNQNCVNNFCCAADGSDATHRPATCTFNGTPLFCHSCGGSGTEGTCSVQAVTLQTTAVQLSGTGARASVTARPGLAVGTIDATKTFLTTWRDTRNRADGEIFYRISTATGATTGELVLAGTGQAAGKTFRNPAAHFSASTNDFMVVWGDGRLNSGPDPDESLRYARIDKTGAKVELSTGVFEVDIVSSINKRLVEESVVSRLDPTSTSTSVRVGVAYIHNHDGSPQLEFKTFSQSGGSISAQRDIEGSTIRKVAMAAGSGFWHVAFVKSDGKVKLARLLDDSPVTNAPLNQEEIEIVDESNDEVTGVSVAYRADGGDGVVTVVWNADATNKHLFAQRFNATNYDAIDGSPVQITSTAADHLDPSIVWNQTEWGLTYERGDRIYFRRLYADLATVPGSEIDITGAGDHKVSRIVSSGSQYSIAWVSDSTDDHVFLGGSVGCGLGQRGEACSGSGQGTCASGLTCVDGVCCAQACGSACQACNLSKTPCDGTTCPPGSTCSSGECLPDSCTVDVNCGTTHQGQPVKCVGGKCLLQGFCLVPPRDAVGSECNTGSGDFACNPNGTGCLTTCTPGDPAGCADGKTCNGGGTACIDLGGLGSSCSVGGDCTSGNCVNSICCSSACAGTCQSCTIAETGVTTGTCAPDLTSDPNGQCSAGGSLDGFCAGTEAACNAIPTMNAITPPGTLQEAQMMATVVAVSGADTNIGQTMTFTIRGDTCTVDGDCTGNKGVAPCVAPTGGGQKYCTAPSWATIPAPTTTSNGSTVTADVELLPDDNAALGGASATWVFHVSIDDGLSNGVASFSATVDRTNAQLVLDAVDGDDAITATEPAVAFADGGNTGTVFTGAAKARDPDSEQTITITLESGDATFCSNNSATQVQSGASGVTTLTTPDKVVVSLENFSNTSPSAPFTIEKTGDVRVKLGPNAADGAATKVYCFAVSASDGVGAAVVRQVLLTVNRANAPVESDVVKQGANPDNTIILDEPTTAFAVVGSTLPIKGRDLDQEQTVTLTLESGDATFCSNNSATQVQAAQSGVTELLTAGIVGVKLINDAADTPVSPYTVARKADLEISLGPDAAGATTATSKNWCFTVTASDGTTTAKQNVLLTVNKTNTTPTVDTLSVTRREPIGTETATPTERENLTVQISVTDLDSEQTLTLADATNPACNTGTNPTFPIVYPSSFASTGGTQQVNLTLQLHANDAGTFCRRIKITDSDGNTSDRELGITITQANSTPIILDPMTITLGTNQSTTANLFAKDPDASQTLSFELLNCTGGGADPDCSIPSCSAANGQADTNFNTITVSPAHPTAGTASTATPQCDNFSSCFTSQLSLTSKPNSTGTYYRTLRVIDNSTGGGDNVALKAFFCLNIQVTFVSTGSEVNHIADAQTNMTVAAAEATAKAVTIEANDVDNVSGTFTAQVITGNGGCPTPTHWTFAPITMTGFSCANSSTHKQCASGTLTMTPGANDTPGPYSVLVRVTDPSSTTTDHCIPVSVAQTNSAPVLAVVGSANTLTATEHEGPFSGATPFDTAVSATDADGETGTITFSIEAAPSCSGAAVPYDDATDSVAGAGSGAMPVIRIRLVEAGDNTTNAGTTSLAVTTSQVGSAPTNSTSASAKLRIAVGPNTYPSWCFRLYVRDSNNPQAEHFRLVTLNVTSANTQPTITKVAPMVGSGIQELAVNEDANSTFDVAALDYDTNQEVTFTTSVPSNCTATSTEPLPVGLITATVPEVLAQGPFPGGTRHMPSTAMEILTIAPGPNATQDAPTKKYCFNVIATDDGMRSGIDGMLDTTKSVTQEVTVEVTQTNTTPVLANVNTNNTITLSEATVAVDSAPANNFALSVTDPDMNQLNSGVFSLAAAGSCSGTNISDFSTNGVTYPFVRVAINGFVANTNTSNPAMGSAASANLEVKVGPNATQGAASRVYCFRVEATDKTMGITVFKDVTLTVNQSNATPIMNPVGTKLDLTADGRVTNTGTLAELTLPESVVALANSTVYTFELSSTDVDVTQTHQFEVFKIESGHPQFGTVCASAVQFDPNSATDQGKLAINGGLLADPSAITTTSVQGALPNGQSTGSAQLTIRPGPNAAQDADPKIWCFGLRVKDAGNGIPTPTPSQNAERYVRLSITRVNTTPEFDDIVQSGQAARVVVLDEPQVAITELLSIPLMSRDRDAEQDLTLQLKSAPDAFCTSNNAVQVQSGVTTGGITTLESAGVVKVTLEDPTNPTAGSGYSITQNNNLKFYLGPNASKGLAQQNWCFRVEVTDNAGAPAVVTQDIVLTAKRTNTQPLIGEITGGSGSPSNSVSSGVKVVTMALNESDAAGVLLAATPVTPFTLSATDTTDLDVQQTLTLSLTQLTAGDAQCMANGAVPYDFTTGSNSIKILGLDINTPAQTPVLGALPNSPSTTAGTLGIKVGPNAAEQLGSKKWCFGVTVTDNGKNSASVDDFKSEIRKVILTVTQTNATPVFAAPTAAPGAAAIANDEGTKIATLTMDEALTAFDNTTSPPLTHAYNLSASDVDAAQTLQFEVFQLSGGHPACTGGATVFEPQNQVHHDQVRINGGIKTNDLITTVASAGATPDGVSSATATLSIQPGPNATAGDPTKTWCFGVRVRDQVGGGEKSTERYVRLTINRKNTNPVLDSVRNGVGNAVAVISHDESIRPYKIPTVACVENSDCATLGGTCVSNVCTGLEATKFAYSLAASDLDTAQNINYRLATPTGGECPQGTTVLPIIKPASPATQNDPGEDFNKVTNPIRLCISSNDTSMDCNDGAVLTPGVPPTQGSGSAATLWIQPGPNAAGVGPDSVATKQWCVVVEAFDNGDPVASSNRQVLTIVINRTNGQPVLPVPSVVTFDEPEVKGDVDINPMTGQGLPSQTITLAGSDFDLEQMVSFKVAQPEINCACVGGGTCTDPRTRFKVSVDETPFVAAGGTRLLSVTPGPNDGDPSIGRKYCVPVVLSDNDTTTPKSDTKEIVFFVRRKNSPLVVDPVAMGKTGTSVSGITNQVVILARTDPGATRISARTLRAYDHDNEQTLQATLIQGNCPAALSNDPLNPIIGTTACLNKPQITWAGVTLSGQAKPKSEQGVVGTLQLNPPANVPIGRDPANPLCVCFKVEDKVGTIPSGSSVTQVVEVVVKKQQGISCARAVASGDGGTPTMVPDATQCVNGDDRNTDQSLDASMNTEGLLTTGFCTGTTMICCTQQCDGACQTCNAPLQEGICRAFSANAEDQRCWRDDQVTLPDGTQLPIQSRFTCDGLGGCRTACTRNSHCSQLAGTESFCDLNDNRGTQAAPSFICKPKRLKGQSCGTDFECITNFCSSVQSVPGADGGASRVEGVCCDRRCGGVCETCRASGNGTCTPFAAGTPKAECVPYFCDGTGNCGGRCENDSQCATGFFCEDQVCKPKRNVGQPCIGDSSCKRPGSTNLGDNGFCVDGVCCGDACATEACKRCNVPGSLGTCSAVTAGTTPRTPRACNAFLCDAGGACKTTCATAADCEQGAQCIGGQCGFPQANGSTCTNSAGCTSLMCEEGVCCTEECKGPCKACARLNSSDPGNPGTCFNHPADTDPENGCNGFTCNGNGACRTTCASDDQCRRENGVATHICENGTCVAKRDGGQACANDRECKSGFFCTDGLCCASRACGALETCTTGYCGRPNGTVCDNTLQCSSSRAAPGTSGATGACVDGVCCAQSQCAAGETCSSGTCKKANAQTCTAGSDCQSGNCVDGVCCNTPCAGQCRSCKTTGNEGVCVLFDRGTDPANECGSYSCDGLGRCLIGCSTTDDCRSGSHFCDQQNLCQPKLQEGKDCNAHTDCALGFCFKGTERSVCDQSKGVVASGKIAFCSAPGGAGAKTPWLAGIFIIGMLLWLRRRRRTRSS